MRSNEENKMSPVKKIFNKATVGIIADIIKINKINTSLGIGKPSTPKSFLRRKNTSIMLKAIKSSVTFIITI
jgi:hypothetical protein